MLPPGFCWTPRSRNAYIRMSPWYTNAKYRMKSSRGGDSDGRNRNNVMPRSTRRTLKRGFVRGAARGRVLLSLSKPSLRTHETLIHTRRVLNTMAFCFRRQRLLWHLTGRALVESADAITSNRALHTGPRTDRYGRSIVRRRGALAPKIKMKFN